VTGAVRSEERVPAGGQTRDRLARQLRAGCSGDVDSHPHRVGRNEGEQRQAPEQQVPLEVRRRADGADDHDSEHGQEETDEAAAGVHGVADEGTNGAAVSRGQIRIPRAIGALRGFLLRVRVPRSPRRLPPETSGIDGSASRFAPAHRALAGHGVPGADVGPAARCRRWAAIRTGAFSSPYPA
jgi:hypothetical protein